MGKNTGDFVWYDLMTTDVEGAKAFYTEVLGVKTQAYEQMPDYTMWKAGEKMFGGVMTLPEEAAAQGAPPHWMACVAVDDVAETTAKAKELGATVYKEPTDIPGAGRFAVLADPQGAAFQIYSSDEEGPDPKEPDDMPLGEPSWHELNTTDWETARSFYETLFAWKETDQMDMGPEMGTYWMFKPDTAKRTLGGMSNAAKVMSLPPHWLVYFTVDDVEAGAERVKSNGGKILHGPMEVPGGDMIVQCADPQGAAFALHAPKKG